MTLSEAEGYWDSQNGAEEPWDHWPQASRAGQMTSYALKGRNEKAWAGRGVYMG